MNKKSYIQLVQENLKWLDEQPKCLERDHIQLIVEKSVEQYYGKSPHLPPKIPGWNHSKKMLVKYDGNENHSETFGIAYYHYNPPFEKAGKWIDFSGNSHGRVPSNWWDLSDFK